MFVFNRFLISAGLLFGVCAAQAAPSELELLKQELKRLQQRVEQLEAQQAKAPDQPAQVAQPAASEDGQPDVNPLERATVSGSFLAVGQSVTGPPQNAGTSDSQLNYRADLEVEIPLGQFDGSGTTGLLFTNVRLGQGAGVMPNVATTFTGAVNSTAFELAGNPENSTALLAQMWLQVSTPVREQGRFDFTVGKIDPFVFFDNNAIADDESEAFVNNVFVHNPQLDSGGDIGADQYGFGPGAVGAYSWGQEGRNRWTAQLGLFGAGNGAQFDNSLSQPFSIAQLQYEGRAVSGLPGTYQLYLWNNPQSQNALTSAPESHRGFGVSLSQQVSGDATVFSRLGYQSEGVVNFDSSLTLGAQWTGGSWGRNQDRVGLAYGALFASDEYRAANPTAKNLEGNAEVFYTWQYNDYLHVSPHLIYVSNPGALPSQDDLTVMGVRTKASF
ncbi:MAG: carbohydrate porin [Limnobacter sp.]|nr:carbohydrate porin [Limnobacter sp.]